MAEVSGVSPATEQYETKWRTHDPLETRNPPTDTFQDGKEGAATRVTRLTSCIIIAS